MLMYPNPDPDPNPNPDLCVAALSPTAPPQERFQLEGAKCLIWNQHSLNVSSD